MVKIARFYFDNATYRVADENDNEVLLMVDYKNNRFELVEQEARAKDFVEKVGLIAVDLLKKKHGVNFAGKF